VRARIGQQAQDVGVGGVIHIPPDTVHELHALEDTQLISRKDLVEGKGSKGWSAQAPVKK